MNIERMKFAWARGARAQRHCHCWADGNWDNIPMLSAIAEVGHDDAIVRIHPEDAPLEYGPMSTALLELAQHEYAWKGDHPDALGDPVLTPMQWAAREYAIVLAEDLDSGQQRAAVFGDHGGWQLWLGFVAEYLADQGL